MLKRIVEWMLEPVKSLTDWCLVSLLRSTSWFGRELTDEGKAEQGAWREQRLRSIRGLGLISRRRQLRQERK
jgi:hypothetical protein